MTGLLLVNLGTPDAPDTASVRRYLRAFLGDPAVIDINRVSRWLLLNLVILPFRPAKSAKLYQKIWTPEGSPLFVHGQALAAKVAARLGSRWRVELAMRYGRPGIDEALARLDSAGVERVVVFPLYPQYAPATTGTTLAAVEKCAASRRQDGARLELATVGAFYAREEFLAAFAERAREVIEPKKPDHVLFSFHGLPERQVRKADPSGTHCLASPTCCEKITEVNRDCYRAQCLATARALAGRLRLSASGFSVCFQSRLGRTPWLAPYTDLLLQELAHKGVERVAVVCPAFVADCLETLEEIALRNRETFVAAGGKELYLVPSLNASDAWVDAVAQFAREAAPW